jgi:hypothetical protein
MPMMKPPENAVNPSYGRAYITDQADVKDCDVDCLKSEGWTLVVDETEAAELGLETEDEDGR